MARKAKQPTTIDQSDVSQEVQQEISTTVNTLSEHSERILSVYGDGEPFFELRLCEEKAREAMERGTRAMVDAGRHLIVIKEHTEHGDWLNSLERIGIAPRAAQRMMQAAAKFLSNPGAKKLLTATGSRSKLLELMMLDDEDLEQLGDGGTVGNLELDDVDRMSCSELRKQIRDLKAEKEAKDRVMEKNRAKIDELQTQSERVKKETPDEVLSQVRTEASQICNDAEATLRVTVSHALEVVEQYGEELDQDQTSWLSHQLDLIDEALLSVREKLGIERSLEGGEPVWANPNFDTEEATE